jgi:hypothetical protein
MRSTRRPSRFPPPGNMRPLTVPPNLEDPHWLTLDLWFDPEQQQRFGKAKGISGTVKMSEVKEAVLQAEQEKVRPSLSVARSKSSQRAPRSAH